MLVFLKILHLVPPDQAIGAWISNSGQLQQEATHKHESWVTCLQVAKAHNLTKPTMQLVRAGRVQWAREE